MRYLILTALLCGSLTVVAQEQGQLVTDIVINRQNIFDDETIRKQWAYRLANRIHRTTREQTILRQIAVRPGDSITPARVREIERILRALGIFALVNVSLRPSDDGQGAVLQIDTRDQLTLIASASGSFVGGIGEVGLTVGQRNLGGRGDSITLGFSGNTRDEALGAISYRDLHFLRDDLQAQYRLGRTEEGDFGAFAISRPFRSLAQRRAWRVSAGSEQRDIDFYESGASVIQVPEQRSTIVASSSWRRGPEQRKRRHGFLLRLTDTDYQPAQGLRRDEIQVPQDNLTLFAGVTLSLDEFHQYREITSLDTLHFVQDIRLGGSIGLTAGFNLRDQQLDGSRFEPSLQLNASRFLAVGERRLASLRLAAAASSVPAADDTWSLSAGLRGYDLNFAPHTLAFRLDMQVADNGDRLPSQVTLGENSGLRGYAAREFAGQRRVRLNLEDRFAPGWRLGPFDIGAIAFADAGWVADRGESLSRVGSSLGVGLRIGSNSTLGGNVMRIDFAMPLEGDDRQPLLSVALGQVFSF